MNKNLTEIVFILDESGSMYSLKADTVGGFNSMLAEQKNKDGEAVVTTVFFSDSTKTVHDRIPLADAPELTDADYMPNGCTALNDAVGETIRHIEKIHKYIRDEDVPGQTVFIITTDGMENASRRYSASDVKKMIERKHKENWTFIFTAANIDVSKTAKAYGISEEFTAPYIADSEGAGLNIKCMSEAITQVRTAGCVKKDWSIRLREDVKRRKNN